MGMKRTSRTTLARVNNELPAHLYKQLFFHVLAQCQRFAPKNKFKIDDKIYLLDATTIDICLSVFPWAKKLKLPKGSYVVFDRGYTDYSRYQSLMDDGIFFVARLKKNAIIKHLQKRSGRKPQGVSVDQEIKLGNISEPLRLISYTDPETKIEYHFVTNAVHLEASDVAGLYKERWQIELFFKWIKQHLKIKTFLGTSLNAVLTQIWVALITYLLIVFMKFSVKLGISMLTILQLLQLPLFERRNLATLFTPEAAQHPDSPQLSLFSKTMGQ